MIKVAICDDEPKAAEMIAHEVGRQFVRLGEQVDIARYESGTALKADVFSGTSFQVIFLDIGMPDINGISLGKRIKERDDKILIVFVSGREDHVFESFAASPFRFIRKTAFKEEISKTISDIVDTLKSKSAAGILIKFRQSFVKINPFDILYVEAENKVTRVVLTTREIESKTTLSEFEEILLPYGFIKVHRSYLVNYRFIFAIHKEDLILDNRKTFIPISRHRLSEVKNEFQRLTLEEI